MQIDQLDIPPCSKERVQYSSGTLQIRLVLSFQFIIGTVNNAVHFLIAILSNFH